VHVRGVSTDCKVLWRSIRRSDSHFVTKTGLDSVVVSLILRVCLAMRLKGLNVRLTIKKSV
jgi:hypothetical protein